MKGGTYMNDKPFDRETEWDKVLLTDNPFGIVPARVAEPLEWADIADLKNKIERRIINSLQTSPSCIVLNYGEWGGGKTHAAVYFTQERVLKQLADRAGTSIPLGLNIVLPRATTGAIKVLYRDILGRLRFDTLGKALQKFHQAMKKKSFDILFSLTGSEDFANSFIKLAEATETQNTEMRKQYEMLRAYFNLSIERRELRQLGLVRSIESISDIITVLTAILNILVYDRAPGLPLYSEILLWIDELEEFFTLPSREQDMLRTLLRDLIDYVPNNLTLFLNITLKTGVKFEDIPAYIGDAVMFRIQPRHRWHFTQLDDKNGLWYVKELLGVSRGKYQVPTPFYPFKEDALKTVLSGLSLRTPRSINDQCTYLIECATVDPNWKPGKSFIDFQFLKGKLPDLVKEG